MTQRKKIIIADDDPGILDAVGILLEFEGYEVCGTPNGTILLNITDELPALVLLDIWMSGVDGRDICRQLKQQPGTCNIPVVLLSASKDIELSALESGADDFLAKPFEMADLLEKIEKYAGNKPTLLAQLPRN